MESAEMCYRAFMRKKAICGWTGCFLALAFCAAAAGGPSDVLLSPAPADDQRGAFLGLSLATDRADLSRAVLEGVALNLRWLQEQLVETLGTPFPRLRFAGGGALSAVWAQILADVTSTPIDVLESPRLVNARGAAWIAYERLGRIRFDDIPALLRTHAVYEPDGRLAAVYDERKRVLVDLHERLADPVRRLHRPPGSRE